MFEEYQNIDRWIAEREFVIRYPWTPADKNIGGGRSPMRTDGPDSTLASIEDDNRIIYLRRLKKACAKAVSHLTPIQKEVYEIRYQSESRVLWPDVQDICDKSHSRVYQIRYCILESLAIELGWLS